MRKGEGSPELHPRCQECGHDHSPILDGVCIACECEER